MLRLTQFADTEGSFLFPPSCCSAGSCQLIVVGLLKPFSLRWVGGDLSSAALFECWAVFRIHSPFISSHLPRPPAACSASSLVFRVPHWDGNRGVKAVCFQLLLPPCIVRRAWSIFSNTTVGTGGAAVGCPPTPPFLQGRQALLPQSLPPGKVL